MIPSCSTQSIPNSVNQILEYFTELSMLHIISLHRNINMIFYTEEPQVFGATVQNRFVQNLCTLAVLVCLELFSKGTQIVVIQITN
jgi:hypothetical protein